jgi:hypothetical protein
MKAVITLVGLDFVRLDLIGLDLKGGFRVGHGDTVIMRSV